MRSLQRYGWQWLDIVWWALYCSQGLCFLVEFLLLVTQFHFLLGFFGNCGLMVLPSSYASNQ